MDIAKSSIFKLALPSGLRPGWRESQTVLALRGAGEEARSGSPLLPAVRPGATSRVARFARSAISAFEGRPLRRSSGAPLSATMRETYASTSAAIAARTVRPLALVAPPFLQVPSEPAAVVEERQPQFVEPDAARTAAQPGDMPSGHAHAILRRIFPACQPSARPQKTPRDSAPRGFCTRRVGTALTARGNRGIRVAALSTFLLQRRWRCRKPLPYNGFRHSLFCRLT